MSEKILNINDIEICAESFGSPDDPTILLIMGAMASMTWWDKEFCQRIADQGRYVIRYDNRDVGRSTTYEPGKLQYDVVDMADDAAGVLDAYNINRAHLVGMSLGGMIVQIVALRNPQKVLTVTAMMSSVFGPESEDLPHIDKKILDYHAKAGTVDWSDKQAATDYMAQGWRLLNGSRHGFDEKRAYELAETEVNRARNLPSMFNHALLAGGEAYYGKIGEINVPALIIHGTEDPVLPYEHALALAREIPIATLLTLEGAGHEIHFNDWDTIITAIIKHSSSV